MSEEPSGPKKEIRQIQGEFGDLYDLDPRYNKGKTTPQGVIIEVVPDENNRENDNVELFSIINGELNYSPQTKQRKELGNYIRTMSEDEVVKKYAKTHNRVRFNKTGVTPEDMEKYRNELFTLLSAGDRT